MSTKAALFVGIDAGSEARASGRTTPLIALRPLVLWTLGAITTTLFALYLAVLARQPLMDFLVYRMGGMHAFGPGLYDAKIVVEGRSLLFTYPPAAALVFWPLAHVPPLLSQMIWNALNLAALIALIVLSIAAARGRRPVAADWQAALILVGPIGLVLYPVWMGLALGQVNVLLALMIVADLTVGVSWRGRSLPSGALVGVAAAIKLTPLVFLPYLALTRQWHRARNATVSFAVLSGVMVVVNPRGSWRYFTKDAFDVQRIGNRLLVGNQSLPAGLARAGLSLPGALGVLPNQVVDTADGWSSDGRVVPVMVVHVEPLVESPGPGGL